MTDNCYACGKPFSTGERSGGSKEPRWQAAIRDSSAPYKAQEMAYLTAGGGYHWVSVCTPCFWAYVTSLTGKRRRKRGPRLKDEIRSMKEIHV